MFVSELSSIYISFAASKGLSAEIISERDGNISIEISGNGVWSIFKNEIGKHVVQRNPPNDRSGRTHTSDVYVAVFPFFNYNKQPLPSQDVDVVTQKGKVSAGGQNANKTSSAVRMTHKPTGLQVMITGRDQGQNKKRALKILTARVNQHFYDIERARHDIHRKQQIDAATQKRRTYNFKANMVVDHISGRKIYNIKDVMKGKLDNLYDA